MTATLGPDLLDRLPPDVARPRYDRAALAVGMAHVGVGAFHRVHQAEYTDDLLALRPGRWGVVGINIRAPRLSGTLSAQGGLYTRLTREGAALRARVVGSILRTVDSQDSPEPALAVLAAPEIDVVTLTVTEKGYGHRPATGALDPDHPDIAHDLAHPETPRSLPGLILQALQRRMDTHGRPLTVISCDNIPANGAILAGVVRALADARSARLADWIAASTAFPSTMVDRIAPATTPEDIAEVERRFGYRDTAVAVGEPFRQWVIEARFAGRAPEWDRVGATFVDDVAPFELLKMRVLNAAQSALAYLGLLAGHDHSFQAAADPLLTAFVRSMLVTESLPTVPPVPGMAPMPYVETSLARITNTAIRHRNHQIATDGSQKLVQRLARPAAERLRRGEDVRFLATAIAAWMAYLIRASNRFGRTWPVDDPEAARVAAIADRIGRDPGALAAEILAIDSVFAADLAANEAFRTLISRALDGLLSDAPMGFVRGMLDSSQAPLATGKG